MSKKFLYKDDKHVAGTGGRWGRNYQMKKDTSSQEYQDNWQELIHRQCFKCQYYIPLQGSLSLDWGVCSNANSPHDAQLMFEHDGCEHFSYAADEVEFSPAMTDAPKFVRYYEKLVAENSDHSAWQLGLDVANRWLKLTQQ